MNKISDFWRDRLNIVSAILIAGYAISLAFNFSYSTWLFAPLVIFYLPGRLLIRNFRPLGLNTGFFGIVSLAVIYSFCLSLVVGSFSQSTWGFNHPAQTWVTLGITILLLLIRLIPLDKRIGKKASTVSSYNITPKDFIAPGVVVLLMIVLFAINPLTQDIDNYLVLLKQSISENFNFLLERSLFNSFLRFSSTSLSMDIAFVHRTIFPALFMLSSLLLYDYSLRNFKNKTLAYLSYLGLIAAPIVLTEANNSRPQSVLMILTLPVLILLTESIKAKNIYYAFLGLIFSLFAIKIHELSFILFLISSLTILMHLIILLIDKKLHPKHILLALIILYPYTKIIDFGSMFDQIITRLFAFIQRGKDLGIDFDWWFLDGFIDADSEKICFSGQNVLLYYLYNGLTILFFSIYLLVKSIRGKITLPLHLLPAFIYFGYFLMIAEIFPRLGFFFLPSRAWIHLTLALILLFILLLEINQDKLKINRLILALGFFAILLGLAGNIYVGLTNIKSIYKEEVPAIDFIKTKLPQDALILSSQYNTGLVEIYANHNRYAQIPVKEKLSLEQFNKLLKSKLEDLSQDKPTPIKPKLIQIIESYSNSELVGREISTIQAEILKTIPKFNTGSNPVYFIYSNKKLNALNTAAQERQLSIDYLNKATYPNLGYPIIFDDGNVLILKLR